MQIFTQISELSHCISAHKANGRTVGFVPTMGALHQGHLSLLAEARAENDLTVVSIFVNPTQFNNKNDLLHYPRTEEKDGAMLRDNGCDILFLPSVDEMYPSLETQHWDFGLLSTSLEGHYRPGHFDGVLTIVKKLFMAVNPDSAYFGEKDFQQLAIIKKMTAHEKMPIIINACPTLREEDGLAMSSRNMRLTSEQRTTALAISRVLRQFEEMKATYSPEEMEVWGRQELESDQSIRLEYLEIVDAQTFAPLADWEDTSLAVALVAAYVGEVRLIDNVLL